MRFTVEEQNELERIFTHLFEIKEKVNKAYADMKIGIDQNDWNLVGNKILELEQLDEEFEEEIESSFTGRQVDIVMQLFRD